MKDIKKNDAGEIIRFRTRRMNVAVARQQYVGAHGEKCYAKRFYYAKMVNGQLARYPLSTVPVEAEKLADEIAVFLASPTTTLDEARRKFSPRVMEREDDYSTIGEVLEFHKDRWKVLELSTKSGANYHHSLLLILRQVEAWRSGTKFASWAGQSVGMDKLKAPWLAKSTRVLTEQLAMDYQRLMVPPDLEDEEEELTQKITCDSNLRNARSIFSNEAMKLYRASREIVLPDLSGFMSVSLFNAKKYFELPDPAIIRAIFMAAPELKANDLNAYRAFLLCVQAGLRKSEAAHLRMAWMREEDITALLIHNDGKFKPKHGHGRKVYLDEWAAQEMKAIAAAGKYFLDGTDTERTDEVFERLNAWLRTLGVTAKKPTHELRKLWFSQKAKREGLQAAAQQGGHRDPKITTSFYASSLMPDNVLPFWQEPTLAALARMKSA